MYIYIYMMRVHFLVIPSSVTEKRQQEGKSRCLHGCRPTSGQNPAMGSSPRIPRAKPAEIKLILILIIIIEGTYRLVMRT
jgi:hypothetical protein